MYNCLDGIKTWALELHHGFTTQGQPWQLGHGLGHLLGNLRTCSSRRLPPCASPSCRRLSDEWMDVAAGGGRGNIWGAHRSKGGANWAQNRPGRPAWADRPRPILASSRSPMLLGQLLTCSLLHVVPCRRLLHGLDRAPCRASFSIFSSGPWSFTASCFGPWAIWSHVHHVSWLVLGFMIFYWSAWWIYPESLLFNVIFLRKQ
jgi:hypothetical protein